MKEHQNCVDCDNCLKALPDQNIIHKNHEHKAYDCAKLGRVWDALNPCPDFKPKQPIFQPAWERFKKDHQIVEAKQTEKSQ